METGAEKLRQSPVEAGRQYIDGLKYNSFKNLAMGGILAAGAGINTFLALENITSGVEGASHAAYSELGAVVFGGLLASHFFRRAELKEQTANILEGQQK